MFNPTFALIIFYVLIALVTVFGIAMAKFRTEIAHPMTEVSEYRDHWQENVHPRDFFRALDIEMANLRYREIPNRVYHELSPTLNMEGSMDKGSFMGDTIQETQPIIQEIEYPDMLKTFRMIGAIVGHIFIVIAALLLFLNGKPAELTAESVFTALFYPGVFAVFGFVLLTIAHVYWAELQFVSYLIQFQGEGTYTESKISVGTAITDSTRSENTVVRTSFTPWVLMAQIVSSTQAKPGASALSNARYVMSLSKADKVMADLIEKMNYFLDEKELIALSRSEKDIKNIEALYALNEAQTKAKQSELTHTVREKLGEK